MYKQTKTLLFDLQIMDFRLKNDAIIQVVGPSGCGKTLFVTDLLMHSSRCFLNKINNIYWLMGVQQCEEAGKTAQAIKKLKNITFLDGFEEGWLDKPQKGDAMVIDDLFDESTREKNFNNLFTKIARHRGVSVIFITQNMFHQGGQHRTRNLNVHYLVLFKNPRDSTIINFIARQAYPTNPQFLIDAFKDATANKPHGYLFMDFTQDCLEDMRVRANIFQPNGFVVYKQSV
jgi:energy-coupling factor transporter ATP-binding protein EcfA2